MEMTLNNVFVSTTSHDDVAFRNALVNQRLLDMPEGSENSTSSDISLKEEPYTTNKDS